MKLEPLLRRIRVAISIVAAVVCSYPAGAIVTRHDRDDRAYRELGERHPAAVSVLPDGAGVLIAPDWVLTAAHVARGVAQRNPRVEVAGQEIGISRIFVDPRWRNRGAHDVALLKLSESVDDVTPVLLFRGDDEVGKVVTFVGRGDHGTGLTGPRTMDRAKRGATNRVDDADADWLYFTFDRGNAATELEGVSGPGDSGGPALLEIDGKLYTLGVSVFADGPDGPGRYGVREGYTRVSTHARWIDEVLAGKLDDQGFVPGHVAPRAGRPPAIGVPSGGGDAELPDDAAGKLVAAYLAAYNSDDEATMAVYLEKHGAAAFRASRTQAEHLAFYRRLYDGLFGRLDLSRVIEREDNSITVLLVGATGSMAEIRFDFEGAKDPKITGMRVAKVEISSR